jgi:hypothetical protein
LDVYPNKKKEIINQLPDRKKDWEQFVKTASDQMVLPAVFRVLDDHGITSQLPANLVKSLQYIYDLNLERNQKIIEHASSVQKILREKGIDCVFMKGTANLLDGLYAKSGDRIMYDIDILVHDKDMIPAVEIMLAKGYRSLKPFIPASYRSTMHFPILYREGYTAGIEIHRMPVQYLYIAKFSAEYALQDVETTQTGFHVFSLPKRAIHNFIHSQLMHGRHYYGNVYLRDLYDLFLLDQRTDIMQVFSTYGFFSKKVSAYLWLLQQLFKPEEERVTLSPGVSGFFIFRHKINLRWKRSRLRILHFVIMAGQKYLVLPIRMLWNSDARNYVFSRITNFRWYIEHVKAYQRMLKRKRIN